MPKMTVEYKGLSDRRVLPKKDLAKHDVDVDKDLEFTRTGEGRSQELEVSETLEKILKADGGFKISAVKDDGSAGQTEVEATTEAAPARTVDATTGSTSKTK